MGFLAYTEHDTVAAGLVIPEEPSASECVPANIGSSKFEAEWWLLIDREKREAYLAPLAKAQTFLAHQWPPASELTPAQ